jgi:archaellum component FlaC
MPPKQNLTDKFDSLTDLVNTMNQTLTGLQTTVNDLSLGIDNVTQGNEDIQKTVKEIQTHIKAIERRVTDCEMKYYAVTKKQNEIMERVIQIESQSRRENLLLNGIPEVVGEVRENCFEVVYDTLVTKLELANARSMKIVRCHRLGPPPLLVLNKPDHPGQSFLKCITLMTDKPSGRPDLSFKNPRFSSMRIFPKKL